MICDSNEVVAKIDQKVQAGFLYGDFQFRIDSEHPQFLKMGVLSTYCPVADSTPMQIDQKELLPEDWYRLLKLARAILEQGTEQVVVVSGGIDTLAVRLSLDYPHIKVFECDHPATQLYKVNTLKMNAHAVSFVSADLTSVSLPQALQPTKFKASKSTLFLFEGVLMYLQQQEVEAQMRALAQLCHSAHMLFAFFESTGLSIGFQKGAPNFVNLLLRRSGEPFLWETTFPGLSQMLNTCGWNTKVLLRANDFQLPTVPSGFHPAAVGECIAHCYT